MYVLSLILSEKLKHLICGRLLYGVWSFESDAKSVVDALNASEDDFSEFGAVIKECDCRHPQFEARNESPMTRK